jgi:Tfp pilus assembly protein PilO
MRNSTALILLLLSLGLVFSFILPQYDGVKALRGQAKQYKEILSNVASLTASRDDLEVKYNNLPQADIERLEKVLPDNADAVSLAMTFDSIAANYGISLRSIRTEDNSNQAGVEIVQATASGPYKSVDVSFSFISSYQGFRDFLYDIEQSLRIIDVKSVSFVPDDTGLYDFEVSIRTYWLE